MSIAVPLYGFGTGGNAQVLINVVGGLTQPANPKYGTIWIQTSTPINGWEVFPPTPTWDGAEGHVYIQNVPATDGNIPNFTVIPQWKRPYGAVWLKLSGAMQRINGAWVRLNAWMWRDNVWTQFSATRNTPEFTYTGDYAIVDDSENTISDFATWTGNWKIRFLTSGTLTFTNLNGWDGKIDIFLVGGGGNLAASRDSGWHGYAGGGSGYTKTVKNIQVTVGTAYSIIVGAKDSSGTSSGGASTAFGSTANGGQSGLATGAGGDGGSGGGSAAYQDHNGVDAGAWGSAGSGGTNGSNGSGGHYYNGTGQGTTTREFGETTGKRYAAGGAGTSGDTSLNGSMGTVDVPLANSGSAGYSGIVIIRNKR